MHTCIHTYTHTYIHNTYNNYIYVFSLLDYNTLHIYCIDYNNIILHHISKL